MTDLRKAAEMALEVFDGPVLKDHTENAMKLRKACDLLRQALAQPEQPSVPWSAALESVWGEQEPVAYSYTSRITGAQGFSHHPMPRFIDSESWDIKPLYTSPPASKPWVGLTDAEVEAWRGNYDFFDSALVKEVEAKLKEKNA